MMPPKKNRSNVCKENPPLTLDDNPFFGIQLDEQQKEFRDAIWSQDNDIVFCNSKSGTGKSLLAVATAKLLVEYGLYDGLVYVVNPVQESKLGFMPGNIVDKEKLYYLPLYSALTKIDEQPEKAIKQLNDPKSGLGWIDCMSHIYMRGINIESKVVILEEFQNAYTEEAKKILTRILTSCKTIVIGHHEQCDIFKNPQNSGFVKYIEHFKDMPRCKVCELSTNYRGWISAHADSLII
jgi:phosphate starvation-inducible PhoH-like protein